MEPYVIQKYNERLRFVLIEKINNLCTEMILWDILVIEYGFSPKKTEAPIDIRAKIRKSLRLPFRKSFRRCNDFLIANINGNNYSVFFDIWSVVLSKNEIVIFDKLKFEDDELLNLIN